MTLSFFRRIIGKYVCFLLTLQDTRKTNNNMETSLLTRLRDFSCGLFFMFQLLGTVALFAKGRTHRLQRSAFYFMLYLLAISTFEFYEFFIYPFLGDAERPLTNMLQMTVVPLAMMFVYRLTHTHAMPWPYALLNMAPYFAALAGYAVTSERWIYATALTLALAHSLAVVAYGCFAVRRFECRLRLFVSEDQGYSLRWLWLILALFVVLAVTWFGATKSESLYAATIYNVLCSVILALICYFVYRQEDMLELSVAGDGDAPDGQMLQGDAEEGPAGTQKPAYHFARRMEAVFQDEEIYLNPTLNINELAACLGTNRTYLSNYINQELHSSFYEYVNSWRVRKAEQLLASTSLPLEEVAGRSGFNSLSSFRRYFIKTVGCTPAMYRRMARHKS